MQFKVLINRLLMASARRLLEARHKAEAPEC